jgi:O-antigen ligase
MGFYDHYTTYAEAMQLLASLACGLFITSIKKNSDRKFSRPGWLLAFVAICFCAALFLTFTRASWLSLLLSLGVMTLLSRERRLLFALALCVALVIPAGLFLLQSKRNLTFFDQKDPSISYRQTVWREGARLLVANPRHLLTGVGMDSIKLYWRAWGLFDGGRLPVGHMHSTPLQIALERGLPTFIAWLALLFLYARMLFRLLWRQNKHTLEWDEHGVLLGAAGGLIGFISSGMVHYNLGDSEVAMVFYLIMGLTLVLEREQRVA